MILIETVGTGQSEIDVAEIADVRVVLSAPGLGDDIQAMKSGLLEIADILVVNKADRPDAERTLQQLAGALSIRASDGARRPLLKTTATTGDGVSALLDEIDRHANLARARDAVWRRRRRARYLIARAAAELITRRIREADLDGSENREIDRLADAVLAGALAAEDAACTLLAKT